MPELDGEIKAKISALRAKSDGWESIEVFEFIKIEWFSGWRFYSVTAIDELYPELPFEVEARLVADSHPDYVLGIDSTSSFGDVESMPSFPIWRATSPIWFTNRAKASKSSFFIISRRLI